MNRMGKFPDRKIYSCKEKGLCFNKNIGEAYCSKCGKTVTVYLDEKETKKFGENMWKCPHCDSMYRGNKEHPEVPPEV